MLRIFKEVRYNLLRQNRTGRYLKYAVGEIILVVIGILIALQINNRNELRKLAANEMQLYVDILDDLTSENTVNAYDIYLTNQYDALYSHLYKDKSGEANYNPDKFYNYLLFYHRYSMFIKEKYYSSLSKITNDKVKTRLKAYIEQEGYTNDAVLEFNEHQIQVVRPYLAEHGISNTEAIYNTEENLFSYIIDKTNLIDYSKLKEQYESLEFDELLFTIRFKTLWMEQNFEWLQESNREFQLVLSQIIPPDRIRSDYKHLTPETIKELKVIGKTTEEIIAILENEVRNTQTYNFSVSVINNYGYELISEEKVQDALQVFKLNTQLHPNEWKAYEGYGECLFRVGEIENGERAYKKSTELNPNKSMAIDEPNL